MKNYSEGISLIIWAYDPREIDPSQSSNGVAPRMSECGRVHRILVPEIAVPCLSSMYPARCAREFYRQMDDVASVSSVRTRCLLARNPSHARTPGQILAKMFAVYF